MKYLREHVLELRQEARRTKRGVSKKIEAALKLLHWYKRVKSRSMIKELVRDMRQRMREMIEQSKSQEKELKELRRQVK